LGAITEGAGINAWKPEFLKRRRYLRRQASVEPVVGIIKRVLGFEQFSLRGLQKVALEWNLVCVAYNLKRLLHLAHQQTSC